MFEILDVQPEIDGQARRAAARRDARHGPFRGRALRLRCRTRQILKGISFEVPAGKTVAIVGPSGAGKSTISRLLFRFYDVAGRPHPDRRPGHPRRDAGEPARRASAWSRRTPCSSTTRSATTSATAAGRPPRTRCARRRAWRRSTRFIERLPEGYDTQVGERGLKLSGGEKQRVAIARTILKAPPILILDEATSRSTADREARSRTRWTRLARPHHARHRAPAVDRRSTPTRSSCSTGARSSSGARTANCSRADGALRRDVGSPARGRRGRARQLDARASRSREEELRS